MELRGDAFNAFNMASYAAPDSTLNDSKIGRLGLISSTLLSQRVMQVSLHYTF